MSLQKISQWNDTVVPFIMEQYSGTVMRSGEEALNNWASMLKATVDRLQDVDDSAIDLLNSLRIDPQNPPTGYRLDFIAGFINVKRRNGESDASLYTRFLESIGRYDSGTPEYVIRQSRLLSGDEHPTYHEPLHATASFLVYTPHGRQIFQNTVRSMGPAGVNGMAAAAIKCGDGSFIGCAGNTRLCGIALDSHIENED